MLPINVPSRRTVTIKFHVAIHMAGVLKYRTCRALHPVLSLEIIQFELAELPFFKRPTKR